MVIIGSGHLIKKHYNVIIIVMSVDLCDQQCQEMRNCSNECTLQITFLKLPCLAHIFNATPSEGRLFKYIISDAC